jgi:hypothetical protein
MAEKTMEAHTFECDAPKCDVTHVCVGLQEPKGIRLTAEVDGKDPVKAYACKPTHIRPAVEAALEKGGQAPGENDGFGFEAPRNESEHGTEGLRVADGEDEALEEDVPVAVGQ